MTHETSDSNFERCSDRYSASSPRPPRKLPGQPPVSSNSYPERLTSPAAPGAARPTIRRRGPGERGLRDLLDQLSPRDLAILSLLSEHRFLTTKHVEGFCFAGHASADAGAVVARRVLRRLHRDELVRRPVRRIGGLEAGSAATVWMLTSMGKRLLGLHQGRGAIGRVREPGEAFVRHYLEIADARLALVTAERAGRLVLTQAAIEPICWRSFTDNHGRPTVLKPDLLAVTARSRDAEFEAHHFIEIDRGTESIPVLLRQCAQYEAYRRTGTEQDKHGVFPFVLWVVPDEARARRLRDAIRTAGRLDPNLYRVTTAAAFVDVLLEDAS